MARFLTYTSPARGHLYPITDTLLELRDRGHEVHLRTLDSEVEVMRGLGIHAEPISSAIEALPLDDWRQATPEEALAGGLRTFAQRSEHEVTELQEAIEGIEPDLLLVDVTTIGAAAVAEASGLPWAQWSPFFQHHFVAMPEAREEFTLVPFTLMPPGMEALNSTRRRVGLEPLVSPAEARRAPLYLYLTARPFEPDELEYPPSVRLVGPGLWEPPADPPDWLAETSGEPLVLVTASSEYQRDDALVHVGLEALATENVRVVASSVAHDPADFDAPENARVERWMPHGAVIGAAACVVCHGGMGITQRALAAGVPVCVVPFGRDQAEVATRVAALDAGTQVAPDALSADSLRAAIRDAMTKRAGAERIADAFRRVGGAHAAADALEDLLAETDSAVAEAHARASGATASS